jgi:High potential iron-sulfur protein
LWSIACSAEQRPHIQIGDLAMSDHKKSDEVSRRNLLRSATIMAGGAAALAATIVATPAEADKMSQKGALYQEAPKNGQQCDGCALFKAPASCTIVDGTISPTGWCRFFSKKS